MSEKVQLWRYYLPSVNGDGWAIIVLGSDGFFAAVSDYGNWAFRWTHHGQEDFRQFLLIVNADYLMSKFWQYGDWPYDGPSTVKAIRKQILEDRRAQRMNREDARREWDLLEEHEGLESEFMFMKWCEDTEFCDAWEYKQHNPPGDLFCFCTKVMDRLKPLLLRDLGFRCDVDGCEAPVAWTCRCRRCDSEPTHAEKFHACADNAHVALVKQKHERIRGKEAVLYLNQKKVAS